MTRLDRDTFEQLVRDEHAAVWRSARRVLRDHAAAEDVAQEVFVRALSGRVPLDSEGGPRGPLCWLATRLALNRLRGQRRRQHNEALTAMPNQPQGPVDRVVDAELQAALHRSICELPDDLRLPLLLRFQDGLTFAAVSGALRIAESTAHERVQQALARLRRRLGPAAAMFADARLQQIIACSDSMAAPPGLLPRLCALSTTAAPAVLPLKIAVGLLLGCAAVVTAVLLAPNADPRPTAAVAVASDAKAAGTQPGSAGATATPVPHRELLASATAGQQPQDPAPPAHATFAGTVRDAFSWPVTNARVVAVAAGNLKPFELASTTTDRTGAFRLEVPLDGGPFHASRIRVQVMERGQLLHRTHELVLVGNQEPVAMDLHLAESVGTETSRFSLLVTVRDPAGKPVADVPVTLQHRDAGAPALPLGAFQPEDQAKTGPDGTATLSGRRAGHKRVWADGRQHGWRAVHHELQVQRPGEQRATIALLPGGELHGRVTTIDGTVPEWTSVWLDETGGAVRHSHHSQLPPDGAIRFTGLGDGPLGLRIYAPGWSPAALRDLRAGQQPVTALLKRANDDRDIGDHLAELHGRLLDAERGEVVKFRSDQVEVLPLLAGESTVLFDRIEPPRPVQRMLDETRLDRFRLLGLDAGSWAVVVQVPGYARMAFAYELRDREVQAGIELRLPRGAKVTGRVLDADGEPVAQAFVFVCGLGERATANLTAWTRRSLDTEDPAPSQLAAAGRTDANGNFALDFVQPGVQLRVVAVTDGRCDSTRAMVLGAGEHRGDLELRPVSR